MQLWQVDDAALAQAIRTGMKPKVADVNLKAMELGPRGILVNCIQAGVTDTPALRMIPGNELLVEASVRRNPGKRLTTPEDIANTIAALADPSVSWISGSILFIDGGEDVSG